MIGGIKTSGGTMAGPVVMRGAAGGKAAGTIGPLTACSTGGTRPALTVGAGL